MSPNALLLFIARRLGAMAVLMVLLSFCVFSLVYLAPGTAVDALLGGKQSSPELVASLNKEYHLNEPFFTQYWMWARDALHLDFGASTQTTLPVTDEIGARLGSSAFLAGYAYFLTLLFGVIPGVIAALRQRRLIDRGLVAGSVVSLSTPPFVLGILLLFSWVSLVHLVRAEFLRVRNFEYVNAARALGLTNAKIMWKHVLPNAMVATLTFLPFIVNASVTTLTSLDFLGLGLPPGSPSLGELLLQGKANLQAPWLGLTGFFVIALMLSLLIFIGEAVRDAFDPRKTFA